MPIYEYRCECGAVLESLERVGAGRTQCGELCVKALSLPSAGAAAGPPSGGPPPHGEGRVERIFSSPGIRGDGREAAEPVFNPVKRARRPGCDDCDA